MPNSLIKPRLIFSIIFASLLLSCTNKEPIQGNDETKISSNETSSESTTKKAYRHFLIPVKEEPNPTVSTNQISNSNDPTNNLNTPNSCPTKVQGTPIGISCLHCAHPKARSQAIEIAEILRDSCRENIALTFLVDGTFGAERDILGELVRIATENGSQLHLYLYFGNGPWQRRTGGLPDRGFGTGIPPVEFRKTIITDETLRNRYRSIIKYYEPLIDYANSRGSIVYVMPMLEDNLDHDSARAMEALVKETILPHISYALGRNPCLNCYPGNDNSLAPGLFLDDHIGSADDQFTHTEGLVVNDGKSFTYSFEPKNIHDLSFGQLNHLIDRAKATNNTFVIWKREYQGVAPSSELNDPDLRNYKEITPQEKQELTTILKTP